MRASSFAASLRARPVRWAAVTWLVSLFSGALALVLADFGAPVPIFALLAAWLWTAGLPTLLSVLACVTAWGRVPGLGTPPLVAFLVTAALLGFVAQLGAHLALARALRLRAGAAS